MLQKSVEPVTGTLTTANGNEDTGATVSVLNEGTWRKSGLVTKMEPVTGTLTTANGNELTVLGETKVRFRLGNVDCFWPVIIARGLSHDCILGSDFCQHFQCQIHYDTGTFVVGNTEIPIRYCKVTPSVCRILLFDDIQVQPGTTAYAMNSATCSCLRT